MTSPPASRGGTARHTFSPLYEIAYAVAQRSANPAAMAIGNTNAIRRSYADRRLMSWELRSARQLDKLLRSTYLN